MRNDLPVTGLVYIIHCTENGPDRSLKWFLLFDVASEGKLGNWVKLENAIPQRIIKQNNCVKFSRNLAKQS